ncbi:MAG: hypothetical protein WB439_17830 [Acidobacteriaceae bacterium]
MATSTRPTLTLISTALVSAAIAAPLLPTVSSQTPYTSPNGRFTLQLPTGWQAEPDPSIPGLVSFHSGAVSVSILVSQQHQSNAMTAKEFIDGNQSELKGQCPTFQNRKSGTSTLLGYPAVTAIATCSDPKSPAVAEDLATLTPDHLLIGFTIISPISRYYATLPLIDNMRSSLRLANHPAPSNPYADDTGAMADLTKACLVGAFLQEDCARCLSNTLAASDPNPAPPHMANSTFYRDPLHRFVVDVPPGWTAKPEGDNGSLGVQLRKGSDWINIMPSKATSAKEAVLANERYMIARSHLDRQPPLGPAGLIQLFSHGTELTYDSMTGSNPDGTPVNTIVAGIAPMSGSGPVILLGSSITNKPGADDPALAVAMSLQPGSPNPAP